MKVRVRLYAGVREAAGRAELELEVDGATVGAVAEALARACPAVADRLSYCRFAVGDAFAGREAAVAPGAVVDVIPPVSGG